MNRRTLLLTPFVAAAALVPTAAPTHACKWGAVDVDRWTMLKNGRGIYLHVYQGGIDVTTRCFYFDDDFGYARLHLKDENGQSYIDWRTRRPAEETITDFVVVAEKVSL